ncbi:MAG: hypothetical protein RLZZ215_687 [Pseudomonadota bacterium]|jgi:hypothetical protein
MQAIKEVANETSIAYQTSDGRTSFKFNIVKVGLIYEIDIIETSEYMGKLLSPTDTHQSISNCNGYRICFGNPSDVTDLDKAREFSREWAELVWKYLRTGETF